MESKHIDVDGLRLHYLEAGAGPPVLLLHGWPSNAQLWRGVIPALAAHRRVLALDLPGYGGSAKPLDASYSFRFYDRVLTGFLDAVGVRDTGLAVHDIGGPIGLHWALHHADRVSALALLNTLVFPEMSAAVKLFIAATYLPGVRGLLSSPAGIAWAMRFGVAHPERIRGDVERLYTAPFEDRAARRALLKAAHGLHPKGFVTLAEGLPVFADTPVRLIYGTADRILPRVAWTMGRVNAALPHAEVTALDGCGHFLQEDRPDEVGRLLADFFGPSA